MPQFTPLARLYQLDANLNVAQRDSALELLAIVELGKVVEFLDKETAVELIRRLMRRMDLGLAAKGEISQALRVRRDGRVELRTSQYAGARSQLGSGITVPADWELVQLWDGQPLRELP